MFCKILFSSSEWLLMPEKIRFIVIEWKAEGSVLCAAWVEHTQLPEPCRTKDSWQQKLFVNNIAAVKP